MPTRTDDEKRIILQTTHRTISAISEFRTHADLTDFKEAFGETVGDHLYQRFNDFCGRDIMALWPFLDIGNRQRLAVMIMSIHESRAVS